MQKLHARQFDTRRDLPLFAGGKTVSPHTLNCRQSRELRCAGIPLLGPNQLRCAPFPQFDTCNSPVCPRARCATLEEEW